MLYRSYCNSNFCLWKQNIFVYKPFVQFCDCIKMRLVVTVTSVWRLMSKRTVHVVVIVIGGGGGGGWDGGGGVCVSVCTCVSVCVRAHVCMKVWACTACMCVLYVCIPSFKQMVKQIMTRPVTHTACVTQFKVDHPTRFKRLSTTALFGLIITLSSSLTADG